MITKEFVESLIGKTMQEARALCVESNKSFRILREDETRYIVTMDFVFDRVNVDIDNGIVTRSDIG